MTPRTAFWKSYYFVTNPFRRLYWRIAKPRVRGVKSLVERDGKFLLVRLAYAHKGWTLPGGAVEKKETFEEAAWRELWEETKVKPNGLTFIGEYEHAKKGKTDIVGCFYGVSDAGETTIDPVEIADVGWFSRTDLPENRAESVDRILSFYDNRHSI